MKKFLKSLKNIIVKTFIAIKEFFRLKISVFFGKIVNFVLKYTGIKYLKKKFDTKLSNKTKKGIIGYFFILPFIIGFIIFAVTPIVDSLRMAFSVNSGPIAVVDGDSAKTVFVIGDFGLDQFKQIFNDNPDHVESIINTAVDILIVVPLVLIFSLLLSLLLNRKIKGIKIFRGIFFIPVILLSGNLLGYFSSYNLLSVPALESITLRETLIFYLPEEVVEIIMEAFSKIILILWFSGVQTLIFLAGLQKTNKPIYEAAAIDGANKWETFWKITFPSLMPLININIVYTTVIYSNTGNELTTIISRSISDSVLYGRDYASSLSWILFIIELLVILIYIFIFKLANRKYTR